MANAKWNPSLSVGDAEIDEQHKWLFSILDRLEDELGGEGQEQAALRTLVDMERYALNHFADEEAYMESVGYPRIEEHRTLHRNFAGRVAAFREELIAGSISPEDLAAFLADWLVRHIRGADLDIAKETGLLG